MTIPLPCVHRLGLSSSPAWIFFPSPPSVPSAPDLRAVPDVRREGKGLRSRSRCCADNPVSSGMSRRTGRSKRLRLYDRGNTVCPICLTGFTRDQASSGRTVTLEHVPIKALGGQARCLTCRDCNAETGRSIDQAAAMGARNRFGVTVDILGKRDTFMLSLDGKALTPPFVGYSKQDLRDLENSESRAFTMSIKVPNARAVAASSLKSAYLAIFSLLGRSGGYSYVRGDALKPIRQRIMERITTVLSANTSSRRRTPSLARTSCW